jgi:hypothetical protein
MDESPDHVPTLIDRGMGVHLNHPINSSMRNPQFVTRSMGVAETSPSVPRRDGEGTYETSWRARPGRLERAQAQGLDVRLHLLEVHRTQTNAKYVRVAPPRQAGILPMPAETNTPHIGRLCEKTLQEHLRSCKASGARPAGPLARPHGIAPATRREESPISKHQHMRDPNGCTHRCSGATVGDSHKGPLNNQGKPTYFRKKNKMQTNLKHT